VKIRVVTSTAKLGGNMVVLGYVNCQMGYTAAVVDFEYAEYQMSNSSNEKILFEGTEDECHAWLDEKQVWR